MSIPFRSEPSNLASVASRKKEEEKEKSTILQATTEQTSLKPSKPHSHTHSHGDGSGEKQSQNKHWLYFKPTTSTAAQQNPEQQIYSMNTS